MLFSKTRSTLLLSLAAAQQAASFKFNFYLSTQCRSQLLDTVVAGPDQGCLTKNSLTGESVSIANAQSAVIVSTGAVDDPFSVTFFSSDSCDPATEVWHTTSIIAGNDTTDSTCFSGKNEHGETLDWRSYQVWDLSNL
ncbi:hypothetical protein HJFPF1_02202 [Paramyrothecium foliicola]|nr:hypothetical protein HJFPF1_02202 [Paramyrothecium foliicola]